MVINVIQNGSAGNIVTVTVLGDRLRSRLYSAVLWLRPGVKVEGEHYFNFYYYYFSFVTVTLNFKLFLNE
jgi:hypothetical protein